MIRLGMNLLRSFVGDPLFKWAYRHDQIAVLWQYRLLAQLNREGLNKRFSAGGSAAKHHRMHV
jgi:hypothetical protein